ncbi:hypothetical protein Droror1_Dr00009515 [Drosera rotundifolia]
MHHLILTYKNLILQSALTISLTLILRFLPLPSLFLQGLNTYIHPDDVNPTKSTTSSSSSGARFAIRRPDNDENKGGSELRNRKKSGKAKSVGFDESKAQIFRLRLGDAQLVSRIHFDIYRSCFNWVVVGCSCFLLQLWLNVEDGDGTVVLRNGTVVPVLVGVSGVARVYVSLVRVSLEGSAFKRSEKQLGVIVGMLGFVVGIVIALGVFPSILDFRFDGVDAYASFVIALLCGSLAGFLFLGTGKNAKAFWLGTDQIRCNLSTVSCQWFYRMLLYASCLVVLFSWLLWINPFAALLVNKNIGGDRNTRMNRGVKKSEKLVGNVGIAPDDFVKFRIWCLLACGVLQALAVRPKVQMYLNEAMLAWYQRLHASQIPELEYSRAKVFLHNHYLCLTVQQFFAPAALLLLFLGLSQLGDGSVSENFHVVCGILPCTAFVREVGLFMAWWVAFVWSICTLVYLGLYRRGFLYVS